MAQPDAAPSTLDQALALAAQGFHVFPLIAGGRLPAIGAWQHRATRDEEQIRKWWLEHDPVLKVDRERPYNIGICTSHYLDRHLVVVDVDMKKGKDGQSTFAKIDMEHGYAGWADTLVVETPSGGQHYFFWSASPVGTTTERIGPGIDTRGMDGFVVAAGSTGEWGGYRVLSGSPILEAPPFILEAAGKPRERLKNGNVFTLLDMQPALDRAATWLKDTAPAAIEGQGGNAATYTVAARVKDFGVSSLACQGLMLEHWNYRCSPPWDIEEMSRIVENAYAYGKENVGVSSPLDFPPVTDDDVPIERATPRPKLFYRMPGEIKPSFDRYPLIDDWVDQGSLVVVYGDSNVGKTFVVMSMSHAVATGAPWHDKRTEKGVVVYVAAEAQASAERRIEALKLKHDVTDFDLALVPCPVDLLRPNADTAALVELVGEIEKARGEVKLIVVDTLAAATPGADESSSESMGAFIGNVKRIAAATRACVLIVHHTGKDRAKGARGWSGLRAAIDTEIEIEDGSISATKQRDLEKGPGIGFRLASVRLGTRPDGKVVTSAVVELGVGRDVDFEALDLTQMERLAVECLRDAIASEGEIVGDRVCASTDAWLNCFEDRYNKAKDGVKDRAKTGAVLRVHRNALRKKLAIEEIAKDQWVTCEA
jgi:archaellum biogenesis ATPase FlaH